MSEQGFSAQTSLVAGGAPIQELDECHEALRHCNGRGSVRVGSEMSATTHAECRV